jgi:hypothetical protein
MGKRIMSAKEYREYADECMRSARNSMLAKECREFLRTAEALLQAADLLEAKPRRTAVVQPNSILIFRTRLERFIRLVGRIADVGRKRLPAIRCAVSARRSHDR